MVIQLDLPENVERFFAHQAQAHQRGLEEELVAQLQSIASQPGGTDPAWERIMKRNGEIMARRGGVPLPDTTEIIVNSRLHDH